MKTSYEQKANTLFSQLSLQQQYYFRVMHEKNALAPFMYVDDCLRNFIYDYCTQVDSNTIFVITGDHTKYPHEEQLPYYTVPLIIWSPLLHTAQQFPNIVAHTAITPSIISFLQNNYAIRLPEKLAWNSMGLDTAKVFNPQTKNLLLDFNRSIDMIYNQYFYHNEHEALYEMDENLYLKKITDTLLLKDIKAQYTLLKYINYYVYVNNKLVHNTQNHNYQSIFNYANADTIVCITPKEKPSVVGFEKHIIMPEEKIHGTYRTLKIHITADVIMNETPKVTVLKDGSPTELNIVSLYIKCVGKAFSYSSSELITKYIVADKIIPKKTYHILIEKEIEVNDENEFSLSIGVLSPLYDWHWDKSPTKTTISNIKVQVLSK
jgi:hypothetical protein